MKKILLLLVMSTMFFFVGAAQSFRPTASNPTSTITDNSVDTLTYTTSHSYSIVSIQPVITKATGTAAGTSILSYSIDGINYVNTDTLTLSNTTTNTTVWNKSTAAKYWRIITGGATTLSATVTARISASD